METAQITEKRKRGDDGGVKGKKAKAREEDDAVKRRETGPEDEEVDEFFAILKRIKVAVNYFKNRDTGRELTASKPWKPSFKREDFEVVVKKEHECSNHENENENAGLDLNSDPAKSDVSYDHSV